MNKISSIRNVGNVKLEAIGTGPYFIGCLIDEIWSKNSVNDHFIWSIAALKGENVVIAGWANEKEIILNILVDEVIVKTTTIFPDQFGSIEWVIL